MAPAPPPAPAPPTTGNRSALLNSIQKGAKLKKVVTDDRSSPHISGGAKSGTAVGATGQSAGNTGGRSVASSSAPTPAGPMGLGGLFAGGMPKLRSTGSRLVSCSDVPAPVAPKVTHSSNSSHAVRPPASVSRPPPIAPRPVPVSTSNAPVPRRIPPPTPVTTRSHPPPPATAPIAKPPLPAKPPPTPASIIGAVERSNVNSQPTVSSITMPKLRPVSNGFPIAQAHKSPAPQSASILRPTPTPVVSRSQHPSVSVASVAKWTFPPESSIPPPPKHSGQAFRYPSGRPNGSALQTTNNTSAASRSSASTVPAMTTSTPSINKGSAGNANNAIASRIREKIQVLEEEITIAKNEEDFESCILIKQKLTRAKELLERASRGETVTPTQLHSI